MTDTRDEPAPMTPDQRARIAALEVVTVLLMRRLALESSSPADELDRLRDRAFADASGTASAWQVASEDVEWWIRQFCKAAASQL